MTPKAKKLTLVSTFLIVIILINYISGIRHLSYSLVPTPGILDEYSYVWQGMSIRREGVPVAWSILYGIEPNKNNIGAVKDFSLEINLNKLTSDNFGYFPKPTVAVKELDYGIGQRQVVFMFPFLDHPPLGGLLMSLGVPASAKTFTDVTLKDTRSVSLIMAIIASVLLFILSYQLTSSPIISTIAVTIYSTVPSFLLASRFALLENMLTPFTLLQTILLISAGNFKHRKNLSLISLLLSGIVAGLAVLIKETALGFILGSIIVLFIWRFKLKAIALCFITPVVVILGIYLSWAWQFSPTVLLQVLTAQSTRGFVGSLNFLSILPYLKFENFPLDGWWLWGFISFCLTTFKKDQRYLPVIIPVICHLLLILLIGGPNFPWYYLSLIPYLAIFITLGLLEIFKYPNFALVLSFILIPLSSSFFWGYSVLHQPIEIWSYRILILSSLIIASLRIIKYQNYKIRIFWVFFCLILFLLLIKWNINSLYFIISNFGKLPFS